MKIRKVSEEEVSALVDRIGILVPYLEGFDSVLSIDRGGTEVAKKLIPQLHGLFGKRSPPIYRVKIKSYVGGKKKGKPTFHGPTVFSPETLGRCLVVDDLVDSGDTIRCLFENQKFEDAVVCVLWCKLDKIGNLDSFLKERNGILIYAKQTHSSDWLDFPWERKRKDERNKI